MWPLVGGPCFSGCLHTHEECQKNCIQYLSQCESQVGKHSVISSITIAGKREEFLFGLSALSFWNVIPHHHILLTSYCITLGSSKHQVNLLYFTFTFIFLIFHILQTGGRSDGKQLSLNEQNSHEV